MEEKYSDSVRNIKIEGICSDSKFGELNFESIINLLKSMVSEVVELEDLDYRNNLTQSEINQIDSARNNLRNYINQIENFSITQPNAAQVREGIIQNLQSYYENSFASQTRQALLYLRDKVRLNAKNSESEYRKLASELQKLVSEVKTEKEKLKADQESIKQDRGIVSSKYLSEFFENESSDAKIESNKLKAKFEKFTGFLTIVVFICFAVYLVIRKNLIEDNSLKIEFAIVTATFVAILFFYVRVLLREYNISKHIQISNKHRANVASTVQGLLSQVDQDPELKTSLVKEASTAIFQSDSTGYLTKDQIEVSTPIKEVVNTIMTKN
ncbi:hypothetical protein IT402_01380 [Candidatus Nomurabacteria bacterium]|nr:hypothetical protein [Candidatus Nomurabacteria bacterium]